MLFTHYIINRIYGICLFLIKTNVILANLSQLSLKIKVVVI